MLTPVPPRFAVGSEEPLGFVHLGDVFVNDKVRARACPRFGAVSWKSLVSMG